MPTDLEQLTLELLNETRLDPMGNARRYINSYTPLISSDSSIQNAITYFSVIGSDLLAAYSALVPVGPLAWNDALAVAAEKHSAAMIAAQLQTHQAPGEASLGPRVLAEGYQYKSLGENVYAYTESAIQGHAGFMIDWGNGPSGMQSPAGHRNNIMNGGFTEIGIDITAETNAATQLGPLVLTQDLGNRGKFFVLGVAYGDADGNRFYSLGEGRGGLQVSVGSNSVTSAASGGYSMEAATGQITVTLNGAGLSGAVTVVANIITENIKLDVVDGNTLLTSGSATVTGAVTTIRGLGVRGLSLTAGAGNQTIEGTAGNDTINGGAGSDILRYAAAFSSFTASSQADGSIRISSAATGTDTVSAVETFRFTDGDYIWNSAQGRLVSAQATANSAPTVLASQAIATNANAAKQLTVAGSDADGDTLTYTAGAAAHGSVSGGGANGLFTYTPTANYSGSDSFNVTVSDGKGGSAVQTVNVTIAALNRAPTVTTSQTIATNANTAKQLTVSAIDPDGDTLTYTASNAAHGSVSGGGTNGQFTYTPTANYSGTDSFTVTVSDGKGGSAVHSVGISVAALNRAPDVVSSQTVATGTNTPYQLTVSALDPDGDALTFAASAPTHGSVSGGGSSSGFTYTPGANYTGADTFTVTVSDGKGGSAVHVVNVSVVSTNVAPTFGQATKALATISATPLVFTANAVDGNGDTLIFSATAASHGTVSGGTNGSFIYTPVAGFTGTDAFVISASDGKGGTAHQSVSVEVAGKTSSAPGFRLIAAAGFVGEIGGNGTVFGSSGFQEITMLGGSGSISFDASFNRGGDIIRLSGLAADYSVAGTGSSALLTNGSAVYTIPVGLSGTGLVFDDGIRTLLYDAASASLKIASQAFNANASQILALAEQAVLPTGADLAAVSRAILSEGAGVTLGGDYQVFGSNIGERIVYNYGDLVLDATFNRGGDTLILPHSAQNYIAFRSGSSVILSSADGSITIPVGLTGMILDFAGEARVLRFDTVTTTVKIGDQPISASSAASAAALSSGSVASSLSLTIAEDDHAQVADIDAPFKLLLLDQLMAGSLSQFG